MVSNNNIIIIKKKNSSTGITDRLGDNDVQTTVLHTINYKANKHAHLHARAGAGLNNNNNYYSKIHDVIQDSGVVVACVLWAIGIFILLNKNNYYHTDTNIIYNNIIVL